MSLNKRDKWRLEEKPFIRRSMYLPLKTAGMKTCTRCFHIMSSRHSWEPRRTEEIVSYIYRKHRTLIHKGYSPEYVSYDKNWLVENFRDIVDVVPYFSYHAICGNQIPSHPRNDSNLVHFSERSSMAYIKRSHPDILFHEIADHTLNLMRGGSGRYVNLENPKVVDHIRSLLDLSPEILEVTMDMERLAT